jgi:DNA-directed RNA polymerase specialized sigma24 family protein
MKKESYLALKECMKTEKWRPKMPADIANAKRESLIQEIFSVIAQWPDIERNVFCEAHYHGQSVEAISRSQQLNEEEVQQILNQCDQRLHASLRSLGKSGFEAPSLPAVDTTRPAA